MSYGSGNPAAMLAWRGCCLFARNIRIHIPKSSAHEIHVDKLKFSCITSNFACACIVCLGCQFAASGAKELPPKVAPGNPKDASKGVANDLQSFCSCTHFRKQTPHCRTCTTQCVLCGDVYVDVCGERAINVHGELCS